MLNLLTFVLRHPLNANGKIAALGRVLRWQVASRLMAGPIAFPFVEDTFLFASLGMTGATGNWYCGLHEHEEMGFMLHFLRSDDAFLDVGANVGSYSILAAGAVGARVVSVEPIPMTFRRLERNVLLNGLSERIRMNCVGLSSENSELLFTANLDTVNHVMTEDEVSGGGGNPCAGRSDGRLAGRLRGSGTHQDRC
ncbi:MAG: FkbM family methyltransferase [Pseudoxanthomonas sp.]